ncbi:MlaD family protein [Nocardia sp. alder85J]|uniref:MlaD family protein n=1 Tax=Nocardia sp. alder85J TaxID=2862949 RepID=UPI001CD1F25F|nr:MlaD family protein [Nocardia sp. alder85J]MCX4092053.1 MlaD family protein [Nocardia sp. alder85J]
MAAASLHRMLGSRAFMSIVGAVALVALVVVGYLVIFQPVKRTESYCAIMPDSIGLYVGNQVTMRGIPVGSVTSIAPQNGAVKVEFAVAADKPVYADAGATTLSDSVVASRQLAVVTGGQTTGRWNRGQCLTKTLTPKSITETLTALAQLSAQLDGPDQDHPDALARGLSALNDATSGTGPQINAIVQKLSGALSSPDADIAHLAGIFDAFASVAQQVERHWGDLTTMLTRLAPVLDQAAADLLAPGAQIMDGLRQVLPMLNDLTTAFGDPIMKALDDTVPLVKFLRADVGSLAQIITMTPVLAQAFRSAGASGIGYAPPRVAVPQANADQVCAVVNALAPGRCDAADGLAKVDLVPLVLATAGAR